jgi:hypothetical protein
MRIMPVTHAYTLNVQSTIVLFYTQTNAVQTTFRGSEPVSFRADGRPRRHTCQKRFSSRSIHLIFMHKIQLPANAGDYYKRGIGDILSYFHASSPAVS